MNPRLVSEGIHPRLVVKKYGRIRPTLLPARLASSGVAAPRDQHAFSPRSTIAVGHVAPFVGFVGALSRRIDRQRHASRSGTRHGRSRSPPPRDQCAVEGRCRDRPGDGRWWIVPNTRREVHCQGKRCKALLGYVEGERFFQVERGGLQISFMGAGLIHLVCYYPRCRHLTVLRLRIDPNEIEE